MALMIYAGQTEEFFKQAAGAEDFVTPQMAFNALADVLQSLGDIKNDKRWSRVQPPETFGRRSVKQHEATETPHRMINDLEVILIIDLGNIQTPSGQYRDQDWKSMRSEATPERPSASISTSEGFYATLGGVQS
ncbi:hypothetical protein BBK36DRAFT_1158650 [Trichoderma citrinoviride]|uniref:Uncharacterized protein n=1 Tax=Trichoderma citrinoviride TaxID=58853 RepID=A0A2T4BBM4_9HYPO|nr:hypothetical protein BBK36DRAFT_1158650 [Trichoderma citrinoviride]PTB66688.1 hypothetical protein BBK36DRAFT_1158650 [Trichoderma citrinoviride]